MHGFGMGGFGMGFPLFGLLLLVLAGAGIYAHFRTIRNPGSTRHTRQKVPGQRAVSRENENLAPQAFRLAKQNNGILTVSDVVSELDINPNEAESLLVALVDGQRVDMQVGDDGVIRYVFREFTV